MPLSPVVTVAAINFGHLLGGAVVVEQIFGIPGIGSLMIPRCCTRDFPVVQGVTLVVAALFLLRVSSPTVLYCLIDPRIRFT